MASQHSIVEDINRESATPAPAEEKPAQASTTSKKKNPTSSPQGLISDAYREQNALMHKASNFGAEGQRWANAALKIINHYSCGSILDYGCGKGTFAAQMALNNKKNVRQYDPAIPKHAALPEPADFVICNDVLEHVEPEYVDNVLDHLQSLILKAGLIGIATKYAIIHTLPDGRNPHLSVHPDEWWEAKLKKRFNVEQIGKSQGRVNEYACLVTPL
jgi:hypothetical protein